MEKMSRSVRIFVSVSFLIIVASFVAAATGTLPSFKSAPEQLSVTNDGAVVMPDGEQIPLPFEASGGSKLAGAITNIGKNVYKVTFPAGTDKETLSENNIYLVHLTPDATIPPRMFDEAMSIIGATGHNVNYYGYLYTTDKAQLERERRSGTQAFNQKFPGTFFASAKALSDDASHGNSLHTFATSKQITWFSTGNQRGNIPFAASANLYLIIVNEPQAIMTARPMPDSLFVTGKSIASADTAVRNQKDVKLFRFEGRASTADDIRLTSVVFEAATSASLANAQNYSLWHDSNNDGQIDGADVILQQGVAAQDGQIKFNHLISYSGDDGYVIRKGETILFEVHADIVASLIEPAPVLSIRFDTGATFVEAASVADGSSLVSIQAKNPGNLVIASNNDFIDGGTTAAIKVTTAYSTLFSLWPQGNLFVSKSTTPVRSQQLLGGVLTSPVFRLNLRADAEDVFVSRLNISVNAEGQSIDRLELWYAGFTTPFAVATVAGCESYPIAPAPATTFCATMPSGQLVAPKDQQVDIVVRPRLKTDVDGAKSSNAALHFYVLAADAVEARGMQSSNVLTANNGDATAKGELIVGLSSLGGTAGNANKEIVSADHNIVLSKIESITNANPDADGTAVPTGTARAIGQFKFKAAAHANTKDGSNDVVLRIIKFEVAHSNISINNSAYKFYNKADMTTKTPCSAVEIAPDYSYILCDNISAVAGEIDQGTDKTFVLETEIYNSAVNNGQSSMLQVRIKSFQDIHGTANFVRWADADSASSVEFTWFDFSADDSVNSTRYEGGTYNPPPPPVTAPPTMPPPPPPTMTCGNGMPDPGEQCDDGNQVDTDDCTNQCQTFAPLPL